MTPQNFFMTGCASGIGRHLAGRLLSMGHRVYATDINIEALDAHREAAQWQEDMVYTRQLDVADPDNWAYVFADAVKKMDHVDVAMNIAGVLCAGWTQDMPAKEVHMQVDVNVKGVIFGTQEAARHMIPRREGHIINIASMASLAPIPGLAVYCGTKYAVRGFSTACNAELKDYNIAVTTVCPDGVKTPMTDIPIENEAADIIWSGGKLLQTEDIGRLIVERVLPDRPIVVAYPTDRMIQARLGDLFPSLGFKLLPWLQGKGRSSRRKQV